MTWSYAGALGGLWIAALGLGGVALGAEGPLGGAGAGRIEVQSSTFTSLSAWEAAAPAGTKNITFRSYQANQFPASDFLPTHGVTFDLLDIVHESSIYEDDRRGLNGQGPSQLVFSENIVGVAALYPEGLRIEAYNENQERVFKGENVGVVGGRSQFFGVILSEPASDVILFDWTNNIVGYDTLYIAYAEGSCFSDGDGDGFTACTGDCDDGDPLASPGSPEIPGDGIDNNCDGQVDEGACAECTLAAGPLNPAGALLEGRTGARGILLQARLTNAESTEAITVEGVTVEVDWPAEGVSGAAFTLSLDRDCDGDGEGLGSTRAGESGSLSFSRSDALDAEASLCYLLEATWQPGSCPSCGEASARLLAGGIDATFDGAPVPFSGGPVTGRLDLAAPPLTLESAPEDALSPGDLGAVAVSMAGSCGEGFEARVTICEAPEGAQGQGLVESEGEALAFVPFEGGEAAFTFIAGDRPGAYALCVEAAPAGSGEGGSAEEGSAGDACPVSEGEGPLRVEILVSGLGLIARHDGDPGEIVGTFLTGVEAPNAFEIQLALPPGDLRTLNRVDFTLEGALLVDVAPPFEALFDMAAVGLESELFVVAELSDGAVLDQTFPLFGIPLAEWAGTLESRGAAVETTWDPEAERYAIVVEDLPPVSWRGTVPGSIPLIGGLPYEAELAGGVEAGFHLTRATSIDGLATVTGRMAGVPFTLDAALEAALDPELNLLPGARATGRAEARVATGQTLFRTAPVPLLGTSVEIAAILGASANLHSASVTTFDTQLNVEEMTLIPQVDAFLSATTTLRGESALAELGARLRVCGEVDARLSHRGAGADFTQEHFGGAVQYRVDVLGSLFWGGAERGAQLGGVTVGPTLFGDGPFTPAGSSDHLARCDGEEGSTLFLPRVALDAERGGKAEGRVILLRTLNVAGEGEAPDAEITALIIEGGVPGAEVRVTDNARWELDPAVSFLSGGEALGVWTANIGAPTLGDLGEILAHQEIVAAHWDGDAWSEEIFLTDDAQGDGIPQVAYDAALNQALVVWLHDGGPGGMSIQYRIFDGEQRTFGPRLSVPRGAPGPALFRPRVAATGAGRFALLWVEDGDGVVFQEGDVLEGGAELLAESEDSALRWMSFDGAVWSEPADLSPADGRIQDAPTLSAGADGRLRAAWVSRGLEGDRLEALTLPEPGAAPEVPSILDGGGAFIEGPQLVMDAQGEGMVLFRKHDGAGDALVSLSLAQEAAGGIRPGAPGALPEALTRDEGMSWAPTLVRASDGRRWAAWASLGAEPEHQGILAGRLSPGVHLAPLGGAARAAFAGPGRLRSVLEGAGLIEALALDLDVDVLEAGRFSLGGRIFDRGERALGEAWVRDVELAVGRHTLTLLFPGRELRDGGVDGPFRVGDLVLMDHAFSPRIVAREGPGVTSAALPAAAFVPSRLDTGGALYTGAEDRLLLTVRDPERTGLPRVEVRTSAAEAALEVELPEVGPGLFQRALQFTTGAAGEGEIQVEAAGLLRARYTDGEGRRWASPVAWVPPAAKAFPVQVRVTPAQGGRVVAEGIDCPRDCVRTAPEGASVALEALPQSGFAFAGWSGACEGLNPVCVTIITDETQIGAIFEVDGDDEGSGCATQGGRGEGTRLWGALLALCGVLGWRRRRA